MSRLRWRHVAHVCTAVLVALAVVTITLTGAS